MQLGGYKKLRHRGLEQQAVGSVGRVEQVLRGHVKGRHKWPWMYERRVDYRRSYVRLTCILESEVEPQYAKGPHRFVG